MLLAIDIGNSSTKFGVFDSSSLLDRFSIPTERDYTVDELGFDRLQRPAGRFLGIDTVIVSSVVPEMDGLFRDAIRKHLNIEPRFVDHTFDFGLKMFLTDDEGRTISVQPDHIVQFEEGERHRLVGVDDAYVIVAEIWQHTDVDNLSNEEDIVRLADDYNR